MVKNIRAGEAPCVPAQVDPIGGIRPELSEESGNYRGCEDVQGLQLLQMPAGDSRRRRAIFMFEF